jgi:hypothetical protein
MFLTTYVEVTNNSVGQKLYPKPSLIFFLRIHPSLACPRTGLGIPYLPEMKSVTSRSKQDEGSDWASIDESQKHKYNNDVVCQSVGNVLHETQRDETWFHFCCMCHVMFTHLAVFVFHSFC